MNQNPTTPPSDIEFLEILKTPQVIYERLQDDGTYPNNPVLPLIAYRDAVILSGRDSATIFERFFHAHHWGGSWRNGVYNYHHYHSTAHEVLGVYGGSAKIQFGGEQGIVVEVQSGDVVLIPAGVAHKNLGASLDFRVVGAYPAGQYPDMNYGEPEERPQADRHIKSVPLPSFDPLYGTNGPLHEHWRR